MIWEIFGLGYDTPLEKTSTWSYIVVNGSPLKYYIRRKKKKSSFGYLSNGTWSTSYSLYNFKCKKMPQQVLGSGRNSSSRTASQLHCSGEGFQLTEKSHVTKTKSPHCLLYPRAVVQEGGQLQCAGTWYWLTCVVTCVSVVCSWTPLNAGWIALTVALHSLSLFSLKMGMKCRVLFNP